MSYERHHAIVVTTALEGKIEPARAKAIELGLPASNVALGNINGVLSFLVAPDGSGEGWSESDDGDAAREAFVSWLNEQRYEDGSSPFDWVEVQYGDDERETKVVRDSDSMRPVNEEPA